MLVSSLKGNFGYIIFYSLRVWRNEVLWNWDAFNDFDSGCYNCVVFLLGFENRPRVSTGVRCRKLAHLRDHLPCWDIDCGKFRRKKEKNDGQYGQADTKV